MIDFLLDILEDNFCKVGDSKILRILNDEKIQLEIFEFNKEKKKKADKFIEDFMNNSLNLLNNGKEKSKGTSKKSISNKNTKITKETKTLKSVKSIKK